MFSFSSSSCINWFSPEISFWCNLFVINIYVCQVRVFTSSHALILNLLVVSVWWQANPLLNVGPSYASFVVLFVNLLYIVGFEYSYKTKHYLLLNIKIDTQISFIIFFPLSWISNSFWSINSSFVSGKPVSVLTSRIQLLVLNSYICNSGLVL